MSCFSRVRVHEPELPFPSLLLFMSLRRPSVTGHKPHVPGSCLWRKHLGESGNDIDARHGHICLLRQPRHDL